MKNLRKNYIYTIGLFLLCICFLFHAKQTADFAQIGLNTWFEHMITSLFPFMVLMNLLLKTGLSALFIRPFYYFLKPLLRNTPDAVFVIFFGFLCGFPLGAKCAIDLYKAKKISKDNAEYLLCFSNNIGPAYMLGFFIDNIRPGASVSFAIFSLYVIPLLYGIILRHTIYKKALDNEYHKMFSITKTQYYGNVFVVLPSAVTDALVQLSVLGGYMILFNALRIIPHLLFQNYPGVYVFSQSILEISGGLLCVNALMQENTLKEICLYAIFSFNGLCCLFQTFSLFQNTPFSAKKYMLHKIILCSITVLFVWLFNIK